MRNALRFPLVGALLAASVFAEPSDAPPRSIGFVLEMSGDWLLNGKTPVRKGQALPPGASLRLTQSSRQDPASNWCLTVVLMSGRLRGCAGRSCLVPLTLPTASGPESSLLQRISEAAFRLMGRDPEKYQPAMSRADDADLRDGLALLDGALDLTDLVRALPPGRYALTFSPINRPPGRYPSAAAPVSIEWNSTPPLRVPPGRVGPGLYRVRLLDAATGQPGRSDAWLLVANPDAFKAAKSAIDQALALTREWRQPSIDAPDAQLYVSQSSVRSLIRAMLEELQRTGART